MQEKESIKVYIKYKNGRTVCICKRPNKRCNKDCQPDVVERDRFRGWESTMNRSRFGKGCDHAGRR